ncbi:MAG: cytochrome c maturation protein CcmE [Rickettsiales bacterium]
MKASWRRLWALLAALGCAGAGAGIIIYALRDNMLYYYSPSDVYSRRLHVSHEKIRVGGLVQKGSVSVHKLNVAFTVTDGEKEIRIRYVGLLPALFREGQGMIALGTFDASGTFVAESLLAKHDEKYMPPEVAKTLKNM